MDFKESTENLDGNELGFEEEEQIDEENNQENDAVENLEKKIYESQENIKKLAMVTREKEKEKRILKKKIQELQEQLIEIEKKNNSKSNFQVDTSIENEIFYLKSINVETQTRLNKLENEYEDMKKKQAKLSSNVPLLKKFTDFTNENELLERHIKTEYYETFHETVHAYKMTAEEIKHDLTQLQLLKDDLESEQKKARENTSELRKLINEVKNKEHKLQEDLESLKTNKIS